MVGNGTTTIYVMTTAIGLINNFDFEENFNAP